MHDTEFIVVFLACITLALGALTRMAATRIKIPYTIAMLLLGLAAGIALRRSGDLGRVTLLTETFGRGAAVSPHLIIFVFLPALVFESAYALDLHTFRKNLAAVSLLAVPALILATLATGLLMVGITSGSWHWELSGALVFGALISATDPVAVVAILRETGAPKRLSVLIEGESLLNDGTAIVIFSALLAVLSAGGWGGVSAGDEALTFVWVVCGGVGVGAGLAAIVGFVMGRSFNDPLVEITLTLTLAYGAMIVAEGLLHVSGVLAVVTAGLYMGGPGRTRISPEVHHFLHQFWEMLAHIANTLIFFLVGLVIAVQVEHMSLHDLLIILFAYGAIMALRVVLTFSFRPLLGMVGDPVSSQEAAAMSWGGLRGAVSLALALMVSQNQAIPAELRQQILLTTAGVVFLTILVNGGTTGWLLARLGFTTTPLSERVAELSARAGVLAGVRERIENASRARDLKMVPWVDVSHDLQERHLEIARELERAHDDLREATGAVRAVGYWRQALSIERQAYWSAFAQGTLSAQAARVLDKEIDAHLDRLGRGTTEPPLSRLPSEAFGLTARALRRAGLEPQRVQFGRLSRDYELSRAITLAASSVREHTQHLEGIDDETRSELEIIYAGFLHRAKERIEDLRSNLPEVARAIETRLARRIQLNFEREGYEQLAHHGGLDAGAADAALDEVERQMQHLAASSRRISPPETAEICRELPIFAGMNEADLAELAEITEEQVLSPGDLLFELGDVGDSMYVVVRGAVHVIVPIGGVETVVEVLGGGDILGEMALITGEPRTATIRAATTVTVGRIRRDAFEKLIARHPALRAGILDAFTRSRFDNHVRDDNKFKHLDHGDRLRWLASGSTLEVGSGQLVPCASAAFVFVAIGEVQVWGSARGAPCLMAIRQDMEISCSRDARVVTLPRPEELLDEAG